ncbi:MAG: tyrosine-type recombinase/integrase [Chloroflexi bacterium]|nr:tyrosine-type recombinase/integrase [Chloroflexota bacterium]
MKALGLAAAIRFYLGSRRRLGFALKSEGTQLRNLVQYAQHVHHRGALTTALALNWAQVPPPASLQRARRLEAVRHFAVFWAAFDPRTQIPPAGLFGSAYRRGPVHLYTSQELAALLAAAAQLPPPQSLRPVTFRALLGLLACTGLRISEALQLQWEDWEPTEAVLTIRQSKFGQSRYVPLAPSAAAALNSYGQARAKAFPKGNRRALFLNRHGQPLSYQEAGRTFCALRQQLGWQQKKPRPRLHDLRHSFAVACLLGWYRRGQEQINTNILSLAVYLGHRNIRHTYWYLTAVPELLALGSARWAKALAPQQGASDE